MTNKLLESLSLDPEKSLYPSLYNSKSHEVGSGRKMISYSPVDQSQLAKFRLLAPKQMQEVLDRSTAAFEYWRNIPAPQRGMLVKRIGELVAQHKSDLAEFIVIEAGKTIQEALGEVQEWIDICDFAVGLSRQLHGLTIASERDSHRMMEQWHPLGPIAVISAFNFPMAVWAWNAMLAFVCGNSVVWKPSEKTPLCALAAQAIVNEALSTLDSAAQDISITVIGDKKVGQWMSENKGFPLVSATGSVPMGKHVAATVGARLGRSLLELGGNNAMIVSQHANLDLAVRAIVFSAVGTSGQRCTTLRRLIVHESIKNEVINRVVSAFESISIGDPNDESMMMGPLIDEDAYSAMQSALQLANKEGGECIFGGQRKTEGVPAGGVYVSPALVCIQHDAKVVHEETFAPILYVMTYDDLATAIDIQNEVPQGLSSAIFTDNIQEAERFLAAGGSDCGIANVSIGSSGAEIGGAFGGEKDTGGGRESGSDAWKNYMRRTTNTINYGSTLPLAQ